MPGFVDEAQLHAKAGDGGAGSVSFRREAHVAKGGPDGGDGGHGGNVWLVADHNVSSLIAFKDHPHRRATNGTHGQGKARHGARGDDMVVPVPEGTVVRDRDGRVVADLVHDGDRWMAARGGQGGRGNTRFLSNRRRAPSFAEQGEVGEEQWYDLELKLMADVALVGFPNAGQSTFISRMSAVTGDGVQTVVGELTRLVSEVRAEAASPQTRTFVIHRPEPEGVRIEREDDGSWRVLGRAAERTVALSDISTADAMAYIQYRLKS